MKKSICIVLCTVLLIFTSRFIYHEICARATYDGVIVGSRSVGEEKSICFFYPNHVDEYMDIRGIFRKRSFNVDDPQRDWRG